MREPNLLLAKALLQVDADQPYSYKFVSLCICSHVPHISMESRQLPSTFSSLPFGAAWVYLQLTQAPQYSAPHPTQPHLRSTPT